MFSFKIKKILSHDFIKNILTLMSGTAVAQLITIASIPLLTRLFSPEEFGTFAVFTGLSSLLSSISGGRYELAIMLPKKDIRAYHVLIVSLWFVIFITLLSFFFLFLFFTPISQLLEIENSRYFIFLIPISVFFQGTYNIFSNWFSRFKTFKTISVSKVLKSGTSVSSKIGFSTLKTGALGLIYGELIGQFFSSFLLFVRARKLRPFTDYRFSRKLLKVEMVENKNFPLFSMPMAFLNSISVNILVYVLSILFNSSFVGLYSQANKVINYPLSFISTSFMSVFYQKLTTTAKKCRLYLVSYLFSFFIATLILLPVLFFGEELFRFVLGEKWAFSGKIATVLIPLAVAGFATRNVSTVFALLKLQQVLLVWQVIYLSGVVGLFFFFKDKDLLELLLIFSLVGAFLYIGLAFVGYKLLKKQVAVEHVNLLKQA